MKTTYVMRNGRLVPKIASGRQSRPNIISDIMPATLHPGSGEYFESKSAYRRTTRRLGLTEVGNEIDAAIKVGSRRPPIPEPNIEALVARAYEIVESRS